MTKNDVFFPILISKFYSFIAENIEYIIPFIDPRRRILIDIKADQFNQADFDAINDYVMKRGVNILAIA